VAEKICEGKPDVRRKVERTRVTNVGDVENDTREKRLKRQ
jgi:hypothetical protein